MSSSSGVSLIECAQYYVNKMIEISGMKALIMDKEAAQMSALVVSQTTIIQREVFLIEPLEKIDESTSYQHLKAIVFARPQMENLRALKKLIASNKYKEFHLFFTNVCSSDFLRQLAECDVNEVIRTVQEYYLDYYPLTEQLFTVHVEHARALTRAQAYWLAAEKEAFSRQIEGVMAIALSIKRKPEIRYSASSELTKLISTEIVKRMAQESDIFNFHGDPPLLLILDRRDDPVTPLLTQWTYQAMVHEILGIHENRVNLKAVEGVNKAQQEVVLSSYQDPFFQSSMFLNFGDLGARVKQLVAEYQRQTHTTVRLDTIEQMQAFIDKFPEFRQMSGNVAKHVTLMHELSNVVNKRKLLKLSEVEQALAVEQDHAKAIREIYPLLEDFGILFHDKVRLVALYALRYERESNHQIGQLKAVLRSKAQSEADVREHNAIDEILKYAGAGARGGDLFSNKSILAKFTNIAKSGLAGVENIYTQHKPLLAETLGAFANGKLKANLFPFVEGSANTTAISSPKSGAKSARLIVYFVGGCTYEELVAVDAFNKANPGNNVWIGGSSVLNSHSFIEDILKGAEQGVA